MNKQHLTDYLKAVVELEKLSYEQLNILNKLNYQYHIYNEPKLTAKKKITMKEPQKAIASGDNLFYAGIAFLVGFGGAFVISSMNALPNENWISKLIEAFVFYIFPEFWKNFGHALLLGLIFGVILGLLVLIVTTFKEKSRISKKYSDETEKYQAYVNKTEQENRQIEIKNKNYSELCKYKANIIMNEINTIKPQLLNTKKILDSYYALNIIYPKYRNMACVTSMLEYILSGRCDSLTGQGGAYNLLEDDIKFGIINDKLDVVIRKLDEIKTNQNYLYEALQECNSTINSVSNNIINSVKKIETSNQKANKQIQSQLRSIDYTNRVSQANTQYLADMKHYEIWLR